MTRLDRLYAVLLLGGGLLFAAPELLPRSARGMGRRDLGLAARVASEQWNEIEHRLKNGRGRTGDDAAQLVAQERRRELFLEAHLRDAQTAVLLLVTAGSLVFLVVAAPRAIRLRRGAPGGGIVEVMSDETIGILEGALETELAKLAPTRRDAALRLEPARHHCAYCGKPTRWKVLGRIGRRILVKKPPPGAKDLGLKLGEGWWYRAGAPEPCAKCGSTGVVAT